jgi:hypothetical protein
VAKHGAEAAAAHAAAHAAKCQEWRLVSCGAEGRVLTWQLPTPQELAGGGGMAGGGGLPGRGGADRAGRWGAPATPAQPPPPPANDVSDFVITSCVHALHTLKFQLVITLFMSWRISHGFYVHVKLVCACVGFVQIVYTFSTPQVFAQRLPSGCSFSCCSS